MILSTTSPPARSLQRPANELALRITGRDHVSWSQIQLMRSCPQKFHLQYIEKAEPDFLPSNLLFGGAVHAALEFHFRARMEGLRAAQSALLDVYHSQWRSRMPGQEKIPIRYCKNTDEASLSFLAGRMLASFLASPLSEPAGEVLAVEEKLQLVLDRDLPDVVARVDLAWRDEQSLHVVDFKTARGRWNPQKAQESGEQLLLYHHMATSMSQDLDLPIGLHFIVLTKTKTPGVEMLDVAADRNQIQQIKSTIHQVWSAVTSGNFYPNPSPMNCTSCAYRSRCPLFSGR